MKCTADACVDSGSEIDCDQQARYSVSVIGVDGSEWLCEEHLEPAISTIIGANATVTVRLVV